MFRYSVGLTPGCDTELGLTRAGQSPALQKEVLQLMLTLLVRPRTLGDM